MMFVGCQAVQNSVLLVVVADLSSALPYLYLDPDMSFIAGVLSYIFMGHAPKSTGHGPSEPYDLKSLSLLKPLAVSPKITSL